MKYSWPRITLHWISAVVIIWGTVTGFYVAIFDVSDALKDRVSFINVSLTTMFIPVFILRLVFAWLHPAKDNDQLTSVERHLARFGHILLYLNIIVVLVSGVLMMTRDINVFHLIHLSPPLTDPLLADYFHSIHICSCMTLAGLVLLHVLAVVKHHINGKKVLHRMVW